MASDNPYAPPGSDEARPRDHAAAFELADRQTRFFGAVIDLLVSFAVIVIGSSSSRWAPSGRRKKKKRKATG